MRKRTQYFTFIIFLLLLGMTTGCERDEVITVIDIDGNVYTGVKIGAQIWMTENLKTTKYSNGDLIGTTTPATLNTGTENRPKYQWAYNGDENNVVTYGRLYTWFTVTDNRNICPVGWHIPTDTEWHDLVLYLDNSASLTIYESTTAGSKLKESGTMHWQSPNTGATNDKGFAALPGGYRYNNGTFYGFGSFCIWWSTTEDPANDGNAWIRILDDVSSGVGRSAECKYDAYSIRCLRN